MVRSNGISLLSEKQLLFLVELCCLEHFKSVDLWWFIDIICSRSRYTIIRQWTRRLTEAHSCMKTLLSIVECLHTMRARAWVFIFIDGCKHSIFGSKRERIAFISILLFSCVGSRSWVWFRKIIEASTSTLPSAVLSTFLITFCNLNAIASLICARSGYLESGVVSQVERHWTTG